MLTDRPNLLQTKKIHRAEAEQHIPWFFLLGASVDQLVVCSQRAQKAQVAASSKNKDMIFYSRICGGTCFHTRRWIIARRLRGRIITLYLFLPPAFVSHAGQIRKIHLDFRIYSMWLTFPCLLTHCSTSRGQVFLPLKHPNHLFMLIQVTTTMTNQVEIRRRWPNNDDPHLHVDFSNTFTVSTATVSSENGFLCAVHNIFQNC